MSDHDDDYDPLDDDDETSTVLGAPPALDEVPGADDSPADEAGQVVSGVAGTASTAAATANAAGDAEDAADAAQAAGAVAGAAGGALNAAGVIAGAAGGEEARDAQQGLATAGTVVAAAGAAVAAGAAIANAAESGDAAAAVGAAGSTAGAAGALGSAGQALGGSSEAGSALGAAGQVARGVQSLAQAASSIAQRAGSMGSSSPHDDIELHFTIAGSDVRWVCKRADFHEALSTLYEGTVVARCTGDAPEVRDLLGLDCRLSIERPHSSERRDVRGMLRHLTRRELHSEAGWEFTFHFVPALWALTRTSSLDIFQDKTVPDVVEQVIQERLGSRSRTVRRELSRDYPVLEYITQYQESHFAFVARLLEDEGIFFYFDHEEDEREVLVLCDSPTGLSTVRPDDDGRVPFRHAHGGVGDDEAVSQVDYREEIGATDVTVGDFDWTHPSLTIRAEQVDRGEVEPALEVYDHTRAQRFFDYDDGGGVYAQHDATVQAQLRAELLDLTRQHWQMRSTVVSAAPGRLMTLEGAPEGSLDQRYLIASTHFTCDVADGNHGRLDNQLECVPASMAYRPQRTTPRPTALTETAIVVGPSGEEIHTDQHGRIKVQFHWDRRGQCDEHSSCWLRVAQGWSGPGWGSWFLPRIGMEVIVTFLGGDPDRPLVTACVFNGDNRPPYPLPDDKTKSTIKTNSSPGGDGYNELRFEDKAGSEEIFTHAQKDYNEVVEHCHTTHVKVDQSNTVDHDHTEIVGNDQKLTVKNDRRHKVKHDEFVTVHGYRNQTVHDNEDVISKKSRNRVCKIDDSVTVEEGNRTIHVQTGEERETYEGGRDTTVRAHDNLRTLDGANRNETITGQRNQWVTKKYTLIQDETEKFILDGEGSWESDKRIQITAKRASLDMKGKGETFLDSPQKIVLRSGDSAIELSPTGIKIQAPQVEIVGGEQSLLKLDGSEAQLAGPQVSTSAQTFMVISGLIIRLN